MNTMIFGRELMINLASAARDVKREEKHELVLSLKDDVNDLWHYLADLRQRNVIDSKMYQAYVKQFSSLRNIIAQKEQEFSA